MISEPIKKVLIAMTLGLLTVSAFFVRLESFTQSIKRSTDEVVYYTLAHQVLADPFDYNVLPYAKVLKARGRALPEYFTQPLYKYPPLFTVMTALALKMFGANSSISVYYVPLLAGVLMIPLVYLLGARLFNRITGLLAAILLFIDPIAIACSQKIWIETSLVFFSLLSLLFFIYALSSKNTFWFILSGIACGLATNIKYPGIFLLAIYVFYALIYKRPLFRLRAFWFCLVIPFIMLVPWMAWNMEVYGVNFFLEHLGTHMGPEHRDSIRGTVAIFAVTSVFFLFVGILQGKRIKQLWLKSFDETYKKRLRIVLIIAFCITLTRHILRALDFYYIPTNSWAYKMFLNEPPTFYFGRLIEYSLIYLLGFFALFKEEKAANAGRTLIKITILFYLFFYTMWGNFQSRYILLCSALLIILGVYFFFQLLNQTFRMSAGFRKGGALLLLIALMSYIVLKMSYLNQAFIYRNDFCYF